MREVPTGGPGWARAGSAPPVDGGRPEGPGMGSIRPQPGRVRQRPRPERLGTGADARRGDLSRSCPGAEAGPAPMQGMLHLVPAGLMPHDRTPADRCPSRAVDCRGGGRWRTGRAALSRPVSSGAADPGHTGRCRRGSVPPPEAVPGGGFSTRTARTGMSFVDGASETRHILRNRSGQGKTRSAVRRRMRVGLMLRLSGHTFSIMPCGAGSMSCCRKS